MFYCMFYFTCDRTFRLGFATIVNHKLDSAAESNGRRYQH